MNAGRRPGAPLLTAAVILVVGAVGLLAALQAVFTRLPARPPRLIAFTERLRDPLATHGPRPALAAAPSTEGPRVAVPLSDTAPPRLPADGAPRGWTLHEFTGRGVVELLRAEPGLAVRLRTDQGSFALVREVVVDLAVTPVLSWQWKVTRAPSAGDARSEATDDQAVQVYVIFPRWPSPITRSEVIGYVWDTQAPVGTVVTPARAPNVRLVVVQSGARNAGEWQRASRNVREDYQALFRRRPGQVGAVALMSDANDTRSVSEGLVADLAFSRGPS